MNAVNIETDDNKTKEGGGGRGGSLRGVTVMGQLRFFHVH